MQYTLRKRDDGSLALFLSPKLTEELMADNNTRVVLTFGDHKIHCAINRDREQGHYLRLSKSHHKKWKIQEGSNIEAEVIRDNSTYQFQMPTSLEEVLQSDLDAQLLWHKLRPGQQRSIIHQIASVKSIDLQITKSLLLADRLKNGFSNPLSILKANPIK